MNGIKRFIGLIAMVGLFMSGIAYADKPEVPHTLPGIDVVDADYVLAALDNGIAHFLDVRKSFDYTGGSIPGAINCQTSSGTPNLDTSEVLATVAKFNHCNPLKNLDKTVEIISFCNGYQCWRSPKGALALKNMGFEQVKWYRLGINDWKTQGLPLE